MDRLGAVTPSVRPLQPQPRRLSITLLPQLKDKQYKKPAERFSKQATPKALTPLQISSLHRLSRLVWKRLNYSLQQMKKECITESDYCYTMDSLIGKTYDLGRGEKGIQLLSGWLGMRVQNQLIWAVSQLKNSSQKPIGINPKIKRIWTESKKLRSCSDKIGLMLLGNIVKNRLKSAVLGIAVARRAQELTISRRNLLRGGKQNKGGSVISEAQTQSLLRDFEMERLRERVCKLEEHLMSASTTRPPSNTSSLVLQPPPPPKYPASVAFFHNQQSSVNRSGGSFQYHREATSNPQTPSVLASFSSDRCHLEKSHAVLPGFSQRYRVQDGQVPTRDNTAQQQRRNNSSFSESDRLASDGYLSSRQANPFSRSKGELHLPANRKVL